MIFVNFNWVGLAEATAKVKLRGVFMAKKRVFVSFDFDNDKALKDFFIGQSRLPDSLGIPAHRDR